jgi:hypothetical protein
MKNKYKTLFLAFSLSGILFPLAFTQTNKLDITSYLPRKEELGDWHELDSAHVFVGEDLFTLIDGGADMYFEYGFQQVVTAEYQNKEEQSIKVEIYEMKDASAAYGIYSLNIGNQGKIIQIGNEGILKEYYLMFWKDRFLVFLSTDDTKGETMTGIVSIATIIDRNLGTPGEKPALLNKLPKENLARCRFVRGLLGLSSLYTFDTKNIFGVKEGAIGNYPTHSLLLFQYNSDKEATEGFNNAQEILKASNRFSNFRELPGHFTLIDQKASQLCVAYINNLIVVVVADIIQMQRQFVTE